MQTPMLICMRIKFHHIEFVLYDAWISFGVLLVYIAWYLLNYSIANTGSVLLACLYYIEDHFTFVRLEANDSLLFV